MLFNRIKLKYSLKGSFCVTSMTLKFIQSLKADLQSKSQGTLTTKIIILPFASQCGSHLVWCLC